MFTRKHYELFAATINRARREQEQMSSNPAERAHANLALLLVATDLATKFGNTNPRFDKVRFLAACGFPS